MISCAPIPISTRATKIGWALLNLYEETGERDLVVKARELGEVLVSRQGDDGLWDPAPNTGAERIRIRYAAVCVRLHHRSPRGSSLPTTT